MNKKFILIVASVLVLVIFASCSLSNNKTTLPDQDSNSSIDKDLNEPSSKPEVNPTDPARQVETLKQDERVIYLGGGCFWGVEAYYREFLGIINVEAGYANGESPDTSYRDISRTGHAEVVKLSYDENTISLEEILLHYFRMIDPLSLNKQGNDVGTQYRVGVYSENQATIDRVQVSLDQLQTHYDQEIVIENELIKNYVTAEEYHQDYLSKNPGGYCHIDISQAKKSLTPSDLLMNPSDQELKDSLSDLEYEVTQKAGTERAFTHPYDKENSQGIYVDIVSGQALFSSRDKYDAGCGWPSFTRVMDQNAFLYIEDISLGMQRIEVLSKYVDSHLGHVFPDGPRAEGGLRYCMNGSALRFISLTEMVEEGYGDFIPFVYQYK